jgi:hypothetical protein
MSASTSGITYIGTKPIDVMFQVNAGITGIASNNEQFDIALYKNTSLIPGSERIIQKHIINSRFRTQNRVR